MAGRLPLIRFEILAPADTPDAVVALVDTAVAWPEGNFSLGPFDDAQLQDERQVFVDGADEVEAAQILVEMFGANGVRWRAL